MMAKQISIEDKKYLLSLKPEDITFTLLTNFFADRVENINGKITKKSSRFEPYYEFILEKGEYFNKEKVKTTVGQFIYNKLVIERDLVDVIGYVNEPIDSTVLDKIENKLSKALMDDKITTEVFVSYLSRTQWLGFRLHTMLVGSFTMGILKPNKEVINTRNQLLKENKDKIEQGDVITAVKIENQLVDLANKKLKNDPGMKLFTSKARGSFGNNYKNISIMKGPVFNPVTGSFDIVQSNFIEGIRKEDIPIYANSVVMGAYPKAVGTAISGYFSKQIMAALQAIQLDKRGSDCGSKGYVKVVVTKGSESDFTYRYIIEGNKLVLLTNENINKYIGREVKLRSPMFCIGKKLCRTCAGIMFEKLEINNIGLTAARVSSTLTNLSMKKFHDTTTKIQTISLDDISF